MKTLVVRVEDKLLAELEAVCDENRMDRGAATTEAVRRYVAAERARGALGSSELASVYAEFSGADMEMYAPDEDGYRPS